MIEVLGKFGSGHLDLHQIRFGSANAQAKAEHVAKRSGCPVAPDLIEKRPEAMMVRYGELISFYRVAIDTVKQNHRPDIARAIERPRRRRRNEPLQDFDPAWIPKWNKKILPGTETPLGWALPRMMTSYIYECASPTGNDRAFRMSKVLDYFESAVRHLGPKDTAQTLVVKFADTLVQQGHADPIVILKRMINADKLHQDSQISDFRAIAMEMKRRTPKLWKTYQSLPSEIRQQHHIADITI